MDKIVLSFELYRTDTNAPVKTSGLLVVEGDLTGDGHLEAQVSWERPRPSVKNANASGSTFKCGQLPAMRLKSTDQGQDFEIVLYQNPLENRISYSGSFRVTSDVYNLSAVIAEG